jgi:hypothetical protein
MRYAWSLAPILLTIFFPTISRAQEADHPYQGVGRSVSDWTAPQTDETCGHDACDPTRVPCDCAPCCCCQPAWTVTADALIMTRGGGNHDRLLINDTTSATLFAANDLKFNWVDGPRISIVKHGSADLDLEVNYFGLDFSSDNHFITPVDADAIVGRSAVGVLLAGETADFDYQSRIDSTEINLRRNLNDSLTALLGFRWIELHEEYSTVFRGNETMVNVNADNHLYGAQIGALGKLWSNGDSLYLQGFGKAGLFGNAADQTISVTTIGPLSDFLGKLG